MAGGGEEITVIAKWDYVASQDEELNIKKHEHLILLDDRKSWWKVKKADGQCGYVPSNFVKREKEGFMKKVFNTKKPAKKGGGGGVNNANEIKPTSFTAPPPDHFQEPSLPTSHPRSGNDTKSTQAVAKFAYISQQSDEISLNKGGQVMVHEKSSDGWWRGECNGASGWFPSNYVEEVEEDGTSAKETPAPAVATSSHHLNGNGDQFLHGAVALYPFQSRNAEELNFEADEILDIISKPANDPEWWKARNVYGDCGLVPITYLKVLEESSNPVYIPKSDKPQPKPQLPQIEGDRQSGGSGGGGRTVTKTGPYADRDWYFGQISREEAEELLQGHGEDGDFLIRKSENYPGDYSVSLLASPKTKHFRVKQAQGQGEVSQLCIGNRHFENLDEIVEHYKKAPIFSDKNESVKLYLVKPLYYQSGGV